MRSSQPDKTESHSKTSMFGKKLFQKSKTLAMNKYKIEKDLDQS